MNRTPPADVRRTLRREVGFTCPVDSCGSPYLTYHHFAPPWASQPHHDVNGMVALCLQHHKEADGGAFTVDQLRQLKTLTPGLPVRGRFSWQRERLLIIGGSNFFIGSPRILQYETQDLIWFHQSQGGHGTLNMDLFSPGGILVVSMRDNDWVILPTVDDLESPPSANRLIVRSKTHEISVDIEFREVSLDRVCARARDIFESISSLPSETSMSWPEGLARPSREDEVSRSVDRVRDHVRGRLGDGPITTCELNLAIQFPVPLTLTPTKLEIRPGASRYLFSGCLMGSATVVHLQAPAQQDA